MTDFSSTIVRARQEPGAFRELVIALQRPLFRYLCLFQLPDAVLEEVAQETFVRAWQNLNNYDPGKASFTTWLFTIAKRLALNELNRAANRYTAHHPADDVSIEAIAPSTDGGETHTIQLETQQLLRASIAQLPENFRNALLLHTFGDLSIEQIAELEQCSAGTVKSRIHRARKSLRTLISDTDEVDTDAT